MDVQMALKQLDDLFYYKKINEVEPYLMSCLQTAMELGDDGAILTFLNELMGFYRSQKRYDDSVKIADMAIRWIDRVGAGALTTYINVATCFSYADQYETSLAYYQKAERLVMEHGDNHLKASLYNNMSILYRKLGWYHQALEMIEQALKYAVGEEVVVSELNKVDVYLLIQDKAKAKTLLQAINIEPYRYQRCFIDYLVLCFRLNPTQSQLKVLLTHILYAEGYSDRYLEYYRQLTEERERYAPHRITGMTLCESYYNQNAKELFAPYDCMIGLLGEGSECLGFDDDLSEDHDFGPGFVIIYKDESLKTTLEQLYATLPPTWMGVKRNSTPQGKQRIGVISYKDFLTQTLGMDHLPGTIDEWMSLKDEQLLLLANGKVFNGRDYFATVRRYYPEDIYRYKLALCLIELGKAGQYQYPRLVLRKDILTARRYLQKVMDLAIQYVYLINHTYMPYLKWQIRGMVDLSLAKGLQKAILDEDGEACIEWIKKYVKQEDIESYGWSIINH